ncbi:MAG: hypothetical protein NZ898_02620 [Myxococcota bacterium]|nr:hypothetical protein [Myxococcota bacterium]MDW8361266.1 hypothetical protein [Myxococcales bacterium]
MRAGRVLRGCRHGWAVVFVTTAMACTGAEGDSCELQSDCSDGLVCCKASVALTARGVCASRCETSGTDAGASDAGTDGTMRDAATDDARAADAGTDTGEASSPDAAMRGDGETREDAPRDAAGTDDAIPPPADGGPPDGDGSIP